MNIVFYLLIVSALVFLWFVLAFLFKPLVKFFYRLWDDAKKEMTANDENNNKEK